MALEYEYHPLGSRYFEFDLKNDFGTRSVDFQIRTCGNFKWSMSVLKQGEKEKESCSIRLVSESESDFLPVQTIDLNYKIQIVNKVASNKNIVVTGTKSFFKNQEIVQVEVANLAQIFERGSDFLFSDFFKLQVLISVKEVRMVDCLELIDFYTDNDSINDVKVVVGEMNLYFLKSILCLQSPYFIGLFKKKQKVTLDADEFSFGNVFDFFQIAHGVDLFLDEVNLREILAIAQKFQVPRIIEKCKDFLIDGPMHVNEKFKIAEANEFWDVIPTILGKTKSLKEVKNQNWELDALPDETVKLIAKRVFELSVK